MRLQSLLRQPKLDELLLFHELRVWTVVHDIAAKHRDRERAVDLLGVHVLDLSIEDEVIAVKAKVARDFPAKKGESEDVTVLVEGPCQPPPELA